MGEVREFHPALSGTISYLRWTPDGRALTVEGADFKGRHGIYRVDLQTAEVSLIAQGKGSGQIHQWAPDGSRLFFRRGERVVIERDLASGKEREVMRRENPCRPSLSPDGRYLACVDFGDEPIKGRTLWVVPVEGGEPRALIRLPEADTFGNFTAWTPDSGSILFWVPTGKDAKYWLIPVAGGEPRKIDLGAAYAYDVRIHPDGTRVAFTTGTNKTEVWALENFLPVRTAPRQTVKK